MSRGLAVLAALAALVAVAGCVPADVAAPSTGAAASISPPAAALPAAGAAAAALAALPVKPPDPMTGYSRAQFGPTWGTDTHGCSIRDDILARDMTTVTRVAGKPCEVAAGVLHDPYTGRTIQFTRGPATSAAVQVDDVVALGAAWKTGAQQLPATGPGSRQAMHADPLNLLAVNGPTNEQKGDADAATWLPPVAGYRCSYVARQVAVKAKYRLWVTPAEHVAIAGVLATCPGQPLPTGAAA